MHSPKILACAAILGCAALNIQGQAPVKSSRAVCFGSLDELTVYSPQLQRNFTVDVWTPPAYDPAAKYPVVYMHDGQNLFDANATWNSQAWEIDSAMQVLMNEGAIRPAIIVGVHSNNKTRVADLMPNAPMQLIENTPLRSMLSMLLPEGARGDGYTDFLASTLKPAIDSLYATSPLRDDTFVMGSSMGGLASINAYCLRPDVFGGAAALSTHLTGTAEPNEVFPVAWESFMLTRLPEANSGYLYFDTGDQTIDRAYLPYFPRMVELTQQLGYDADHLLTGFYPGEEHSERSWAKRVATPLRFLLAPR